MIVDDSQNTLSFDHQLSCAITDYHQLSFTLNMFKIFVILLMIVWGKMSLCTIIDYHAPFDQGLERQHDFVYM